MAMGPKRARLWGALSALGVFLGGLIVALTFVRLSLDWSDARPYAGAETEARYLVFLAIALLIAAASLLGAVLIFRRVVRRDK